MSVEKKNAYIGVDLGGTNMRAGRIAGDRLVAQGNAPYVHEIGTATEIFQDLSLVGNHAKLSRATISVGQQLAILDNSTPQARTQGEAHEVINRLSVAKDTLTQSEAIRVVIHINRHGEASLQDLLQMYLLPMRDIHHVIYDPLLTIHHARHTDTDSYHALVPH